jgi:hypothetical protein
MPEGRPPIPEPLKRRVLVEARHRCAICREPAYDLAHIEPWSKVREHTFENLIALCPNCHRRHTRGDIDNQSLRMYKANLSVVNDRYGDYERRVLEAFAEQPEGAIISLTQADIHVLYLVRDGLLEDLGAVRGAMITAGRTLLTPKAYRLTEKGQEFVNRWIRGEDLEPL